MSILTGTLVAVLSFGVGAMASNGLREVTAYVNTALNIQLNGNAFEAYEDDGSAVLPITYNDRTYLPVRAVANACGLSVDYDNDTNTVILGEKSEWARFDGNNIVCKVLPGYDMDFTHDVEQLFTSGQSFESGYVVKADYGNYIKATFDTNGKYQKMRFSVANKLDKPIAESGIDGITLKVYDANKEIVIKELPFNLNESIENAEVDIAGLEKVRIEVKYDQNAFSGKHTTSKIVLGDIAFK